MSRESKLSFHSMKHPSWLKISISNIWCPPVERAPRETQSWTVVHAFWWRSAAICQLLYSFVHEANVQRLFGLIRVTPTIREASVPINRSRPTTIRIVGVVWHSSLNSSSSKNTGRRQNDREERSWLVDLVEAISFKNDSTMDKTKLVSNDLELPPLRSLDDFLLESARFQLPNLKDLEKWGNRVVNNLLYYQTNYLFTSIVIFLIVGWVISECTHWAVVLEFSCLQVPEKDFASDFATF